MVRSRKWGKSNPFSELHRKNIPGYLCLFDIDGIYSNGKEVEGIYEGKYSMSSSDRGNFIESFGSPENIQSLFLIEFSYKIPVWISEESTDKWWKVSKGKIEASERKKSTHLDSSDRIYAGFRLSKFGPGKIYSIFHRTIGEKPPSNDNETDYLRSIFNCEKILVNDSIDGKIYFKNKKKPEFFEGSLKEGSSWMEHWKNLGIS